MTRIVRLVPFLLLAACGPADNDPGPGGVTVGEARALDEAAEMLEQRRLGSETIEGPDGAEALPQTPPADGPSAAE